MGLLYFLIFAACDDSFTQSTEVGRKTFFDVKGYFNNEAQRLSSKGKARKIVATDGKQEERIIDCTDLAKELALFAEADINRPAWSDKYVADTVYSEQHELLHMQIVAVDETMKTARIEIDYSNREISRILIENKSFSSMAYSSQFLVYEPKVGYSIESYQKFSMRDDQKFQVIVRFLN